jgi:hypothetical protein
MRKWLVKSVPAEKDRLFDTKKEATKFCRGWVREHPDSELTLLFRKDMRPTTKYRWVAGQVVAEKLHHRVGAGRSSKRKIRCAAELIDIQLQSELRLTAREAVRTRQALIEVWKEGLHRDGLVWTPAGVLTVVNDPQVQHARKPEFRERRKLWQRKIKIGSSPTRSISPSRRRPRTAIDNLLMRGRWG